MHQFYFLIYLNDDQLCGMNVLIYKNQWLFPILVDVTGYTYYGCTHCKLVSRCTQFPADYEMFKSQ